MGRELKFREFINGKFHYWGFVEEGIFKGPVTPSLTRGQHYQFTGLKDKNGKEIYEGDLFQVANNQVYIIKFFEESENNFEKAYSCFCLTIPERMTFPIDEWAMNNGHIIGNILENPSLINP